MTERNYPRRIIKSEISIKDTLAIVTEAIHSILWYYDYLHLFPREKRGRGDFESVCFYFVVALIALVIDCIVLF